MLASGEKDLAKRLKGCGAYLWLRRYHHQPDRPKLRKGIFCKQALACSFCAGLRAWASMRRAVPKVLAVVDDSPGLRLGLLTLTCKNRDTLPETYREIMGAFSRVVQARRDSGKGRHGDNVFGDLIGGIASVELKRGSDGHQWHPHAHAVVAMRPESFDRVFWRRDYHGRRLTPDEVAKNKTNGVRDYAAGPLADGWSDLLGYQANCDLQPLRVNRFLDQGETIESCRGGLLKHLAEVFKYPLKFGELSDADRLEAWRYCRRKRLLRAFGIFYGVKETERFGEDLSAYEGLPYVDVTWRYLAGDFIETVQRDGFNEGVDHDDN